MKATNSAREDGVARLKSNEVAVDSPLYLHLRSLFSDLEKASINARGRMLDIGCGNKPYERVFAARVVEHVGCDVVQSDEHRVDVICPATEIPLDSATFDTVLCTQVIEHVADHRKLLAEAFRLLKPGGVLLISAPMCWPLHEEPHDFFRFTIHGLRYLLEGAGFTDLEIINNGGNWALCGQVLVQTLLSTRMGNWSVTRRLLVPGINRLFGFIDSRFPDASHPINYIAVAWKPAE